MGSDGGTVREEAVQPAAAGKGTKTGSGGIFAHGFSADWLKGIAMVTMLIDHLGAVLFPNLIILRLIGRISFPIFVWLLVMGFLHTSNLKRYMARMAAFAVISEIPFDLAQSGRLNWHTQNIFLTLLVSLVMLWALRAALDRGDNRQPGAKYAGGGKPGAASVSRRVLCALIIAAAMLTAYYLRCDYGETGPVLAAVFYLYAKYGRPNLNAGFCLFVLSRFLRPLLDGSPLTEPWIWEMTAESALIEFFGIFAVPLINACNGVRSFKRGKYFFYLFYPLHLLLLYVISLLSL